jgi:hypothetical protein
MSSFRFASVGKKLAALLTEVFPERCRFAGAARGMRPPRRTKRVTETAYAVKKDALPAVRCAPYGYFTRTGMPFEAMPLAITAISVQPIAILLGTVKLTEVATPGAIDVVFGLLVRA